MCPSLGAGDFDDADPAVRGLVGALADVLVDGVLVDGLPIDVASCEGGGDAGTDDMAGRGDWSC